ncbi:MAG TPA: PIG-L deacetylase family protein [Anaerolineales bacterium]|jgi:LmbE family N-acetylglucosaminyl deacetylase|nr:PIG-L deacetylase family protein [Anaerolineales bacterium]
MTIETILPIPNLWDAKRILCIQPHYDDNDIAAAGVLTQLAKNGAELFYLTATDDLMGVVDVSLSDEEAANALKKDQFAAGNIVGVKEQYWLGYPDAGEYGYFDLRRDFLKYIRMLKPDFVFAPDAWLTYEGHRDHIQTGLAAAEAVMFAGLTKIPSSDPVVDAAYEPHSIEGIALYFTREPNTIVDISSTWEKKVAAVRCYEAQFDSPGMEQLIMALDGKSRQVAEGKSFTRGEPLKVLHTSALHCGF